MQEEMKNRGGNESIVFTSYLTSNDVVGQTSVLERSRDFYIFCYGNAPMSNSFMVTYRQ